MLIILNNITSLSKLIYCRLQSNIISPALHYTHIKHCICHILLWCVLHGRAGGCAAGLRMRSRFARSIAVEVRHPKSGLVVHTGKPHLQGSYTGIRLWVTLSDEDWLFLSEGECMSSLTITTGLWALADNGTPDIHRSLSRTWQQTRLQTRLVLLKKNNI